MSTRNKHSRRALVVWKRMIDWYGTRWTESYGLDPPPDWCEVIDRTDPERVAKGLALIRRTYLQHPPTFPQFEQAIRPPHFFEEAGPNPAERLCEFVMRRYGKRLTPKQIREPWTYFGNPQVGITGVDVPADGESAGLRVRLEDMAIEQIT
jgi:hypothetical protein